MTPATGLGTWEGEKAAVPSADTREWGPRPPARLFGTRGKHAGPQSATSRQSRDPEAGGSSRGRGTQRKHRVQGLLGISSVIVGDDEALAAPGAARQAPTDTHPHLCPQSPDLHLDLFYS